jgi:hypothetical protein
MLEVFSALFILIWLFDLATLKKRALRQIFALLLAASVLLSAYFSYQTYDGQRPVPLISFRAIHSAGRTMKDLANITAGKRQFNSFLRVVGENIPYIGRDRQLTRDPDLRQRLSEVKTWVCLEPFTQNSLMIMANPKADFIFLSDYYGETGDYPGGSPYEYIRKFLPLYDEMSLYTIVDNDWVGQMGDVYGFFLDDFAPYGMAIVEYEPINLEVAFAHQTHYLLRLLTVDTAERLGLAALTLEEIVDASFQ